MTLTQPLSFLSFLIGSPAKNHAVFHQEPAAGEAPRPRGQQGEVTAWEGLGCSNGGEVVAQGGRGGGGRRWRLQGGEEVEGWGLGFLVAPPLRPLWPAP